MKIKEFIQRLLIGPIIVISIFGGIKILKNISDYLYNHSYIVDYFTYGIIVILILSIGFWNMPDNKNDDD